MIYFLPDNLLAPGRFVVDIHISSTGIICIILRPVEKNIYRLFFFEKIIYHFIFLILLSKGNRRLVIYITAAKSHEDGDDVLFNRPNLITF